MLFLIFLIEVNVVVLKKIIKANQEVGHFVVIVKSLYLPVNFHWIWPGIYEEVCKSNCWHTYVHKDEKQRERNKSQ